MKKLDKLLLKSYIGPLLLTFLITLFVFDMQFLWKYVDDLIGKGLETKVLFELMYYASATMVPMALPLAVLLASIMTFGSFGEHFELTAIKSAGVSLFRFMRPLIIFSVFLALAAFYFSNNILPVANLKFRTLLYDIRHQKPALDFQPGFFNSAMDGFSIRIDDKSDDEKTIYGVLIYDHTGGADNKHIIIADSAKFLDDEHGNELIIVLYNGYDYKEEASLLANTVNDDSHYKTKFEQWEKHFDLSRFKLQDSDDDFFSKMHGMLNIKQLVTELDTVNIKMAKEKRQMNKNLANYYINDKEKLDTLNMFSFDSIFIKDYYKDMASEDIEAKKSVYASASNNARNVKNILMSKKEVIKAKKRDKDKYWVEIHRKFTLSVACLVLFFIGAPLGSIVKKGGLGWPMVMAVLFFVLYHLFNIVGEKSALKGVMVLWQGMWLSTMILLPIGLFLTVKAKNDSQLFNGEKMGRFIRELYTNNDEILSQARLIYYEWSFYSKWSFRAGIVAIASYLLYIIIIYYFPISVFIETFISILSFIAIISIVISYLFGYISLFKLIKFEKLINESNNNLTIATATTLVGLYPFIYVFLSQNVKESLENYEIRN